MLGALTGHQQEKSRTVIMSKRFFAFRSFKIHSCSCTRTKHCRRLHHGARRCDIRRHHSWSPNPSPIHSLFYYKTYFAVLKGTHGSCIYIEIGINLDGSDAKAARLKQTAHAANRHPFSQARHDTTRYYNVFHDWRRGD